MFYDTSQYIFVIYIANIIAKENKIIWTNRVTADSHVYGW